MDYIPTHFSVYAEALFVRALGARIDPETRAALKGIGIDLNKPLLAAYSQEVGDRALMCVIERCFPGVPREEAFRQVGQLQMRSYFDTLVGSAAVQFGRLVGVERVLTRVAHGARSINNFSRLTVEKVGPTAFVLHTGIEPAYLPRMVMVPGHQIGPYMCGLFQTLLGEFGLKDLSATWTMVDAAKNDVDLHLTWSA